MVENFNQQYDNVVSIDRRPLMAIARRADLGFDYRNKQGSVDDQLLASGAQSWRDLLMKPIRRRLVFLDDKATMQLLGFSTIMASGLLVFSLTIAWLIVQFGLA